MAQKLVFVGASGHVQYALAELAGFPQVRFAAYAPSFPGEDVSVFSRLPIEEEAPPQAYGDWRKMIATERPDMVAVCARYDLTGLIAAEAAQRGCHILSEKPAALTFHDLARLRRSVADSRVHYVMMLAMRYDAPFYTARQVVRQGVIGEPYLVFAQKSYRWGAHRPTWYADPARYGSTIAWVGIHAFDYARWVSGVDYVEVCAHHANLVHTERPACQDVATVMARLANEGTAAFTLDYLRPQAAATHGDDRLRIAGARGVIEVCDQGTRLQVITAEKNVAAWPLVEPERTLFGDFVAAVEDRGRPLISAEEAFDITEFALKAAQAADRGWTVRV